MHRLSQSLDSTDRKIKRSGMGWEDYPKTLLELEHWFASEEGLPRVSFSASLAGGFQLPSLPRRSVLAGLAGPLRVSRVSYQTSVTAGTIFQDTRTPLVVWFRAIWYLTSQKNGASASSIQRNLGLRSYQTAWTWMHKLRRAMVRPSRDKLRGRVFSAITRQSVSAKLDRPLPYLKELDLCALTAVLRSADYLARSARLLAKQLRSFFKRQEQFVVHAMPPQRSILVQRCFG